MGEFLEKALFQAVGGCVLIVSSRGGEQRGQSSRLYLFLEGYKAYS